MRGPENEAGRPSSEGRPALDAHEVVLPVLGTGDGGDRLHKDAAFHRGGNMAQTSAPGKENFRESPRFSRN
jgi:hypothetical protein